MRSVGFNGNNTYINLPTTSQLEVSPISICVWIKPLWSTNHSTTAVPLTYYPKGAHTDGRGWIVCYDNSVPSYVFLAGDGDGSWATARYSTTISNQWVHLIGIHDGTTGYIYVNNTVGGTTFTDGITYVNGAYYNPASKVAYVGVTYNAGLTGYWSGYLTGLAVFNTALNSYQRSWMYNNGCLRDYSKSDFYSNCVMYLPFDNSLTDKVSGNTLTSNGEIIYYNDCPNITTDSALDTWVSNTNLVAYFDSTQLDSYPGSGSKWTDLKTGYTASLVNSPTFTDNSLIFNGTTQYANFESSLLNVFDSGSHTVEMWVRPGALVTNKYLVSARSTTDGDRSFFQIATSTTGYSYTHTYGEATYSASTVGKCYSTNTWYHVVGTRYMNTSSLYVNGIKGAASTYRTGDFRSVDRLLAMAGVQGSTTVVNYLSGALGVVRFYDNALTHDEVVQNYRYLRFRYNN